MNENEKKKGFFRTIIDGFTKMISGLADFIITITLPKHIKEKMYEEVVIGKEVYENNKKEVKDLLKENVKENNMTEKIKNDPEKEKTEQSIVQEKEIKNDSKEELEKEYNKICEKAGKVSLGIELDEYIQLLTLAKQLDKEPKFINIKGCDDRSYYISCYEDKDGNIHPSFKDNTDKANKINKTKEEMKEILENAKTVRNHIQRNSKPCIVPNYDFNKQELRKRLHEIIDKDMIKDKEIEKYAKLLLHQDNAYNLNILYNTISSQPEIAAHFGKYDDLANNMSNLGPDIPNIVLRMDYIDKISLRGNFDLSEEINALKQEFEVHKGTLEQVLKIDVSKYENLIQNAKTEIVFSDTNHAMPEPELSDIPIPSEPDINSQYDHLVRIFDNMYQDGILVPQEILYITHEMAHNNDIDSLEKIIDVFQKCPTESIDAICHTVESIQKNTGLKEFESVFYNHYLYIIGLESISAANNSEEIKEFENAEKEKFLNALQSEYTFIYADDLSPVLQNLNIRNEIDRIAESIDIEIRINDSDHILQNELDNIPIPCEPIMPEPVPAELNIEDMDVTMEL